MELDEVARELYAVPPGEFVAARNEYAKRAREAGDRPLADELRKLRRPTQSAWLVNLLGRERRELVEELLEVGEAFRGEGLTRDRLQELTTRRRELLHRLQAEAQRLSEQAGMQLTADRAREVEATLAAAMADPESAEQVRAGRLATPLSYSGLGPGLHLVPDLPQTAPVGGADEDTEEGDEGGADDSDEDGHAEGGGRAAGRGADRAGASAGRAGDRAAERAADRAAQKRAAAERFAERMVNERTEAWQDAVHYRDGLVRRRDELRAEVNRIQQRLDRVEGELAEAEQDAQAAEQALEQARQAAAELSATDG